MSEFRQEIISPCDFEAPQKPVEKQMLLLIETAYRNAAIFTFIPTLTF
jgi:hypothetical protein